MSHLPVFNIGDYESRDLCLFLIFFTFFFFIFRGYDGDRKCRVTNLVFQNVMGRL